LTWKNAFYYNKHTAFSTRKIFIALNIIKTSFFMSSSSKYILYVKGLSLSILYIAVLKSRESTVILYYIIFK